MKFILITLGGNNVFITSFENLQNIFLSQENFYDKIIKNWWKLHLAIKIEKHKISHKPKLVFGDEKN